MKTTDPISVPNLRRDAGDPEINSFLSELVRKYQAPVIQLEDEPDDDGNCVIIVTHGDPAVLDELVSEVNAR